MSLDLYAQNFEAIARELVELLPAADRRKLATLVKKQGMAALGQCRKAHAETATRLLAQPPSKQPAIWQKLSAEDRKPVLLLTLYLALQSASDARQAEFYQQLVGMPYRKALRSAAERGLQGQEPSPIDDLAELLSFAA